MVSVNHPTDVLFDAYVVDIITIVSENPKIRKSTLYEMIGTTSLKPRQLTDKMIECGLLDQTPGENMSIKLISLTEEGERYLSLIKAMRDGKKIESTNPVVSEAIQSSAKGL